LDDWLITYPWLTGNIGDLTKSIWFIGENPSLSAVEAIHNRSTMRTPNLQWSSSDGDKLLRDALASAGLKTGDPGSEGGWNCYLTNAIKEPEIVSKRNELKKHSEYWKIQADRWLPVLQHQIDSGSPNILVAFGGQSFKILSYMEQHGLRCPPIIKIPHYSYVMSRPEAGTRRGPRHPDRIAEFKKSIESIAALYNHQQA
jgi:hypothetical protein